MLLKKRRYLFLFSCSLLLTNCAPTKKTILVENKPVNNPVQTGSDSTVVYPLIESLFRSKPGTFDSVLKNRKGWNVQVLYSQVDQEENGGIKLTHHSFNLDENAYFYPASTVKLPIVLLALQRLNELKDKGFDRNSTMITEPAFSGQSPVYNDPTKNDGRPTIAHYIKKILLVSDNDAYNRLYEFLGQEYINTELHKRGYKSAVIRHRLNIFLSEEENRNTNPVNFLDSNGRLIYVQPARRSGFRFPLRKDSLGNGYYRAGKLVKGPMDFSTKNRISLQDLHQVLISLIYPEAVKPSQRFNLTEDDRAFILKYMSQLPTETTSPPYSDEPTNYWPAYAKFLLTGAGKGEWPGDIRIFNKVGDAYGHMLDIAFVVDYRAKRAFFLSALIYCNSDGILNDDQYDYNTIGLPFMKNLGELIHQYELRRKPLIPADTDRFIFRYDK